MLPSPEDDEVLYKFINEYPNNDTEVIKAWCPIIVDGQIKWDSHILMRWIKDDGTVLWVSANGIMSRSELIDRYIWWREDVPTKEYKHNWLAYFLAFIVIVMIAERVLT